MVIEESLFSLSEKYTIIDDVLVISTVTVAGKSGGPEICCNYNYFIFNEQAIYNNFKIFIRGIGI